METIRKSVTRMRRFFRRNFSSRRTTREVNKDNENPQLNDRSKNSNLAASTETARKMEKKEAIKSNKPYYLWKDEIRKSRRRKADVNDVPYYYEFPRQN
ncbi:hypothetical protein KQX54_006068 [Cotesia glomerata]|uniref:Uncharacterized protein n=1 Tax=Cotesia glomerata TaxID=32391 RepID=A0AAV7J338_COTGL|nr:hypothetical protein KQX54_006068 [Cotesia glomerata]